MTTSISEIKSIISKVYGKKSTEDIYSELLTIIKEAKKNRPIHLKNWDKKLQKYWYKDRSNIMYILYADLFAESEKKGDKLKGLTRRLNYFSDLGITNIHILPILKTSGDAGFAVDDYREIDTSIGSMNDFIELCRNAHKKNIKITFDLVLNHTSDSHQWAKQVKRGNKKFLDYFIVDETKSGKSWPDVHDVFPEFAPGHWDYVPEIDEYVWATFYSRYPIKGKKYNNFAQWDLNYENPEVLISMIDNMLYLANCGVDVFRFDAIPHMWKQKGTDCFNLSQVHDIMRIFRFALEKAVPKNAILVEACGAYRDIIPFLEDGNSAHIAYDFMTTAALWYAIVSEDLSILKKILKEKPRIPSTCEWIVFDVNHDEVSFGKIEGYSKNKNVVKYLFFEFEKDNKGVPFKYDEDKDDYGIAISGTKWSLLGGDQAKNQSELNNVFKKIMLMNAYKLSIGGIPMFYQGEELGMSNDVSYKKDPRRKMDSRFIKRQKISDKVRGERNMEGTKQYKIFREIKRLIEIRKNYKIFGEGETKIFNTRTSELLVFERRSKLRKLLVIINFSEKEKNYRIEESYYDIIGKRRFEKGDIIKIKPLSFYWLLEK